MKPIILLQSGIFSEEEFQETRPIIEKYFDIIDISPKDFHFAKEYIFEAFRGSLHLARVLGNKFEFANCLKFMPRFRKELIDRTTYFTDFADIKSYYFPLFARPVSPFKEFAGRVFTKEEFDSEYEFLKQRNADLGMICAIGNPEDIGREWRCVFIDGKYISGSQYLDQGELDISGEVPKEVIDYAQKLANDDYFLNNSGFVLDICEIRDKLHLVEVNALETSSFYGADLDKIYSAWADYVDVPF